MKKYTGVSRLYTEDTMSERYLPIAIVGSTGSIGTQALDVARHLNIKVTALCANENIDLLEKQIREFSPAVAACFNEEKAAELKIRVADTGTKIYAGTDGLIKTATEKNAATVVTSVMGMIGLLPTAEAIKAKKNIALANKETLVAAGDIIMKLAEENGVKILPVDSEHSAIFQCLEALKSKDDLKKIILTCSGGPFFGKTRDELKNITPEKALLHPTWKMGRKISIDSATLMNKGLELIEACRLFGVGYDDVEILIHRESIVHSLIQTKDNSVFAQMSKPDMRLPIQFALTYPYHRPSKTEPLDLAAASPLTFSRPDEETFSLLPLCRKALKLGGNAPCIVNAANEEAVKLFLENRISFTDIFDCAKEILNGEKIEREITIESLLSCEKRIREKVNSLYPKSRRSI